MSLRKNEAVIKMILKGRSPTMRHVSHTHRVALDCLFDRINLDRLFGSTDLDSQFQIRYIDTKHQLAEHVMSGTIFSFVQYQEFQFDKLLHNGEEDSRSKRRNSCVQVVTSNDECPFPLLRQGLPPHRIRLHPKVGGGR